MSLSPTPKPHRKHMPIRPHRVLPCRIDRTGPFTVFDGTGRFSGLAGSGTYVFRALYTTARNASGCTKVMTGYIESIYGMVTLGRP